MGSKLESGCHRLRLEVGCRGAECWSWMSGKLGFEGENSGYLEGDQNTRRY
nr:MAG TPA_asm: hypothetical protein [Caudoviricetes sp.]